MSRQTLFTAMFCIIIQFLPFTVFAQTSIDRDLFGIKLGSTQKEIQSSFKITEKEDTMLVFFKKLGLDAEYDKAKAEHKMKNMKFFQVSLNKRLPAFLRSADIHLINDSLYQIGLHSSEEYAKKTSVSDFLKPYIKKYGVPQTKTYEDSQTFFWLDNQTKLEIAISPKIINVFLYDLSGYEKSKDEKQKLNDYKNEIVSISKNIESQAANLFLDLNSKMQEMQLDKMLQPITLASKQKRSHFAKALMTLLVHIQETEKKIFELLDSVEQKIGSFKLSQQEIDAALFEYKKGRVKVDICFRKYFDIQKQAVFKTLEIYDFLNEKEGLFFLDEGQLTFLKDSDLAAYRSFIIEVQSLVNQELQAKMEMQNISKMK